MSYTITTDIFCDKCGDWTAGISSFKVDVAGARKIARAQGWTCPKKRSAENKELCPMCNGNAAAKLSDGSYVYKE